MNCLNLLSRNMKEKIMDLYRFKKNTTTQSSRLFFGFFSLAIIIIINAMATSISYGEIVPSDRRIDWENNAALVNGITNYPVGKDAVIDCGADNTGTTNTQSQIQNCLNQLSGQQKAVYLPSGNYKISGTLTIPEKVALRGAGMGKTNITYTGTASAIKLSTGGSKAWSNDKPIISGSTKDSKQIIVSDISGLSVGNILSVHEDEDDVLVNKDGRNSCHWCGDEQGHYLGQFVEITNIDNSNKIIRFNRGLFYTYKKNPGFRKYNMPTSMGVENLTVYCSNTGDAKAGTIYFDIVQKSWVKDVEISYSTGMPIWIEYSYACTVTGSYIHHARAYGSDRGYAVWLFDFNSDHYIYNNVMNWCRYGVNFEGGGTGCIIAYNYIRNVREGDTPSWLHAGVGLHVAHPYMNLVEGNIMPTFLPDNTMGSNSHSLVFRNWLTRESDIDWQIAAGKWCSDVEINSLYHSFVGNIMGFSGMTGAYELNSCSGNDAVFRFGCISPGGSSHNNNAFNTVLRHGNYDYVTKTTKWDPSISDHNIPTSYYLTSKPSWYGGCTWPPVNPIGPVTADIPAKLRYEGSSCPSPNPAPPTKILKIIP
jgi:hypothetical protein